MEAVEERVVSMPVSGISILNMPEGFMTEIGEEAEMYSITLVGLARNLDAVDTSTIVASVDMEALMAENGMESMSAGSYTTALTFNLERSAVTVKNTVNITLNVTEAE